MYVKLFKWTIYLEFFRTEVANNKTFLKYVLETICKGIRKDNFCKGIRKKLMGI